MLEQFLDHITDDLRAAQLDGVLLPDGEKFWLSPIGIKGDWPFLAIDPHCMQTFYCVRPWGSFENEFF